MRAQEPVLPVLPESIENLQHKINAGQTRLEFNGETGYLRSLLQNLNISISSQTLVFAKNSAQIFLISPETPRAIYFNDDVYVGYVQGAPHLEIASVDPEKGPTFYTMDQVETERPMFTHQPVDCLACHDTFTSDQPIPRLLMLSVVADAKGVAVNQSALITNDASPFSERWGGWYVSGTHGSLRHMGIDGSPSELSARFDAQRYLSSSSDIAALMVLGHQTHVHNRITVASRGQDPELLVKALLFSGEARLTEPVAGTTNFAAEFSAQGPHDSRGRSLHQLDLKRRLLRYPLSYLIYSKSFDAMPKPVRDYVYRRLWEVLTSKDQSKDFENLSEMDRREVLEILQDTKPDFAASAGAVHDRPR
jgi:hypothetical protein